MKKQIKKATQVAKDAKKENQVINSNPGYIFRTLNKRSQGKDKDAREVEGYSRDALKELFNRLENTFGCGGFWWGSVYAFNGRLVVSATQVQQGKYYALGENRVVFHFAGNSYIGTLAKEWSENAVIDAAKIRLNLVEQYAKSIDKEQEHERKEQERKERKDKKERKEQAKELTNVIAELKEQVAAGTISQEDAFARVQALMVA